MTGRPVGPSGADEAAWRGTDVVLARACLHRSVEGVGQTHPALRITTKLLHGPEAPELRALSQGAQLLVVGVRRELVDDDPAHAVVHAARRRCVVEHRLHPRRRGGRDRPCRSGPSADDARRRTATFPG